jgi:hypothetical protein
MRVSGEAQVPGILELAEENVGSRMPSAYTAPTLHNHDAGHFLARDVLQARQLGLGAKKRGNRFGQCHFSELSWSSRKYHQNDNYPVRCLRGVTDNA